MSVDFHKHCQETICAAYYGKDSGGPHTWRTIDGLNLGNLPEGWKTDFQTNTNITDDLADILKIINSKVGTINGNITNINNRITIIEGSIGQLTAPYVNCYIAPNETYLETQVTAGKLERLTDSDDRTYYRLRSNWDPTSPDWAYAYQVGDEYRIYPGRDDNIDKQYPEHGKQSQKKYPLFTLNQALQYLRRFRSASATTYRILAQCGDYYYFNTDRQNISLSDATGGSQLVIGPNFAATTTSSQPGQRQNMPCVQSSDLALSPTAKDSDFVKVRFIWDDNQNLHTNGVWPITFSDSNNKVEGCGFVLKRVRQDYSATGGTYLSVHILGGKTTFANCLFRNCRVDTTNPDTSPTLRFMAHEVYAGSMNKYTEGDFDHDHIHKYFLPTIFVDDFLTDNGSTNVPLIRTGYITASAGDHASVQFSYPYIVFKQSRGSISFVSIQASNSMLMFLRYDSLSQLIFNYGSESVQSPPNPFYNPQLSNITYNQASVPGDANAKNVEEQGRVWIKSSVQPEWVYYPQNIFSNPKPGYDSATGVYNSMVDFIESYPALIRYNGNPGVKLDRQEGWQGTKCILPINGRPMPSIEKPFRTNYTFGGYYDQENGGGNQYYDANGQGVRTWDKTGVATLYAKWTANP